MGGTRCRVGACALAVAAALAAGGGAAHAQSPQDEVDGALGSSTAVATATPQPAPAPTVAPVTSGSSTTIVEELCETSSACYTINRLFEILEDPCALNLVDYACDLTQGLDPGVLDQLCTSFCSDPVGFAQQLADSICSGMTGCVPPVPPLPVPPETDLLSVLAAAGTTLDPECPEGDLLSLSIACSVRESSWALPPAEDPDVFDNMRKTRNKDEDCFDGSKDGSRTFCQTDNSTLTYWIDSALAQGAAYNNIGDTLYGSYDTTDLNVEHHSSPSNSGSAETDIVYLYGDVPGGAAGMAYCDDAVSAIRCDQHKVYLETYSAGVGLSCHEGDQCDVLTSSPSGRAVWRWPRSPWRSRGSRTPVAEATESPAPPPT